MVECGPAVCQPFILQCEEYIECIRELREELGSNQREVERGEEIIEAMAEKVRRKGRSPTAKLKLGRKGREGKIPHHPIGAAGREGKRRQIAPNHAAAAAAAMTAQQTTITYAVESLAPLAGRAEAEARPFKFTAL